MKKLIFLIVLTALMSCEQETHYYCWQCDSIIYGKPYQDIFCDEMLTEIEAYKARVLEFYGGGMTSIDCVLLPDTVSDNK